MSSLHQHPGCGPGPSECIGFWDQSLALATPLGVCRVTAAAPGRRQQLKGKRYGDCACVGRGLVNDRHDLRGRGPRTGCRLNTVQLAERALAHQCDRLQCEGIQGVSVRLHQSQGRSSRGRRSSARSRSRHGEPIVALSMSSPFSMAGAHQPKQEGPHMFQAELPSSSAVPRPPCPQLSAKAQRPPPHGTLGTPT